MQWNVRSALVVLIVTGIGAGVAGVPVVGAHPGHPSDDADGVLDFDLDGNDESELVSTDQDGTVPPAGEVVDLTENVDSDGESPLGLRENNGRNDNGDNDGVDEAFVRVGGNDDDNEGEVVSLFEGDDNDSGPGLSEGDDSDAGGVDVADGDHNDFGVELAEGDDGGGIVSVTDGDTAGDNQDGPSASLNGRVSSGEGETSDEGSGETSDEDATVTVHADV